MNEWTDGDFCLNGIHVYVNLVIFKKLANQVHVYKKTARGMSKTWDRIMQNSDSLVLKEQPVEE